jgi:hypothetical protein
MKSLHIGKDQLAGRAASGLDVVAEPVPERKERVAGVAGHVR